MVTNTSIRAPSHAKQGTVVVDFKTRGKLTEDRVIAALESLYAGGPVGSAAIGNVVGMQHRQTLKYLHAAKRKGRVKSVEKKSNGQIAGWVPANVKVTASIAEQRAQRAAAAVCELCVAAKPISASQVARHLRAKTATVKQWLKQAERLNLVSAVPYCGWKPA